MKKGMKATSLRNLLIFLIILMLGATAGAFYLGLQQIQAFALDVSHTSADADASSQQIDELQKLKKTLADSETLVKKADQVFVAENKYQSQALRDIQRYASQYGLTISNTSFDSDASVPLGSKAVVITLQAPASYTAFLQFLNAVEGNLPKMQVIDLNLERAQSGDAAKIEPGKITLTVATR